MIHEIKVKEVIKAGSVFLIKFECPSCRHQNLTSLTPDKCAECEASLTGTVIDIENAHRRLLAGIDQTKRRKTISKKIVRQLHSMQEGLCAYCDKNLEEYHVEHIIPLCLDGSNNIGNLCLSCPRCNLLAGGKYFASFYDKRIYIQNRRLKERDFRFIPDDEVSA